MGNEQGRQGELRRARKGDRDGDAQDECKQLCDLSVSIYDKVRDGFDVKRERVRRNLNVSV